MGILNIYDHVRRETVLPFASGGPARERFSVSVGDEYETFPTWEEAWAFYYTLPRTHWIIVLHDGERDQPLYGQAFTSYEDAWSFLYNKFPSTLPGEGESELDRHAVIPNPDTSE